MKHFLLISLLLGSPALSYTLDSEGMPSPKAPDTYQINTYELSPGYSQTFINRNFLPVQQCTTYTVNGYSNTNCSGN